MRVTASALNVRSGPGTTFRVLSKLPRGAKVEIVEKHKDWAWVNPARGWAHTAYLSAAPVEPSVLLGYPSIVAPSGLTEMRAMFGAPGSAPCSAGRARLPEPLSLSGGKTITALPCHVKLEELFTHVFYDIREKGYWPLLRTIDGIYNPRKKTSSDQWSTHAWGIAVDLNAATNGFGKKGDMDPRIIDVFTMHGFTWGGVWKVPDPMHFQFARNY